MPFIYSDFFLLKDKSTKKSNMNNKVTTFTCCFKSIKFHLTWLVQGGRGHWAAYFTSPQSLLITCPKVLTTNCNLQKGNFVNRYFECTSIYQPLLYPFRSLWLITVVIIFFLHLKENKEKGHISESSLKLFLKGTLCLSWLLS